MARDDLLQAARRAAEVLNDFSVRDRITAGYTRVDPTRLASEASVTVMFRPLERLLGGFLREGDQVGILVNSERPRGLVHMTCAHELGHFFLDHESNTDETVDIGKNASLVERQANQFAYSLLAPQWLIASIMRMKRWSKPHLADPSIIYQLSLRLGTSYSAMIWSLVRLGLLSEGQATPALGQSPKALKLAALYEKDASTKVEGDVWVLDSSDRDRIIEPSTKDRFVVDLPNHAAAGHLWTIDELRCEGFTLEPFTHDARTVSKPPRDSIVVGGLGVDRTLRYSLTPVANFAQGLSSEPNVRVLVSVHETTPWAATAPSHDAFSFSTEFDDIKGGLSKPERARRLESIRGVVDD
ncbi:ImmA/IrrE family metallo-endopeptidase [Paraburkholderia sediminicola]|uniref:ImmA/IrrE family metallo-endopeptidase n=1 Tax=Paraburkholderia sediminicola TaxID=458836 RepID=UPI0038BB96FC